MSTVSFPLVVLRANDVCFLGVLRACAGVGIPVIPVIYDWPGSGPWFSERSKFFKNPQTIPNPGADPAAAVRALVALGRRLVAEYGRKLMLVATSDSNLMLLQDHFDDLAPWFLQMGAPGWNRPRMDVIAKDSFALLMAREAIPIPQTLPCSAVDQIVPVADAIRYPCVYKPAVKDYVQSFQNTHQKRKAVECDTRAELVARLPRELDAGYRLVVQEKVIFEGADNELTCHVYVDAEGGIRLASTSQKEGEIPKPYGSGTISRLTWREELLPLVRRVVRALAWHGMMGIEFMCDKVTGEWRVIEVNFRPWLHIYLQCHFGFNHFSVLAQDAYGTLAPLSEPVCPTAALVAARPLNINLHAAFDAMRTGDAATDICRLSEWVAAIDGRCTFEFLDGDDPEPGLAELDYLAQTSDGTAKTLATLLRRVTPALVGRA